MQMSVVHRTWTCDAQRALHHRVVIRSVQRLRFFALSTFRGAWIHEFAYLHSTNVFEPGGDHRPASESSKSEYIDVPSNANDQITELWPDELLTSVLERMQKLRRLKLEVSFEPDYVDLWSVIDVLRDHGALQALWLVGNNACSVFSLRGVCAILPTLRSLSFLSMTRWAYDSGFTSGLCMSDIIAQQLPASLKTLHIVPPSYPTDRDTQLLTWLVRPRSEYSLKNLFISDDRWPEDMPDYTDIFSECLPTLQTLYFPVKVGIALHSFLGLCRSLRTLYLSGPLLESEGQLSCVTTLPRTLEELCIAVTVSYQIREIMAGMGATAEDCDVQIAEDELTQLDSKLRMLLERNTLPRLRRVTLDSGPWNPDNPPSKTILGRMPLSGAFCNEVGAVLAETDAITKQTFVHL